ncbi:unnamed protein product [Hyaloperonospora brassicae]|uniref:RXLR phytopathogen effector protein WY-domain domain-containing protein n=1 Tax=Hyaloperonospora brassicae TaxID=162125 RepID=A0AAV0UCW6_HYABA|nr:unnamed protein product [Hyaloperonospora brassicae]
MVTSFSRKKLEAGPRGDLFDEEFYAWVSAVGRFNWWHQDEPVVMIRSLMQQNFKPEQLARAFETAQGTRKHRALGVTMTKELLTHFKTSYVDPIGLFALLKLDISGQSIFSRPELSTWYEYVIKTVFRERREEVKEVAVLAKLAKKTAASIVSKHYSIDELDVMLDKAVLETDRMQQTYVDLGAAITRYQNLHFPLHIQ